MIKTVKLRDEDYQDQTYTVPNGVKIPLADGSGMATAYFAEGSLPIIANGSYDVRDKAAVEVNVSGGGGSALANSLIERSVTTITAQDLAGVSGIGPRAFAGCNSLTSIDIPSTILAIHPGAFSDCTSLTSLVIPSSIQPTIFESWDLTDMFAGCISLAYLDLPDISMMLNNTFNAFITALRTLIIRSSDPPGPDYSDIDSQGRSKSIFNIPQQCTIYVPAAAVEDYKTDQYWSIKASQIQAIPT